MTDLDEALTRLDAAEVERDAWAERARTAEGRVDGAAWDKLLAERDTLGRRVQSYSDQIAELTDERDQLAMAGDEYRRTIRDLRAALEERTASSARIGDQP